AVLLGRTRADQIEEPDEPGRYHAHRAVRAPTEYAYRVRPQAAGSAFRSRRRRCYPGSRRSPKASDRCPEVGGSSSVALLLIEHSEAFARTIEPGFGGVHAAIEANRDLGEAQLIPVEKS